jgi:hypothetical protein
MSYPALPCQQRPTRTGQGPMHAVRSTRSDRSGGLSAHVSRKAAGATAAQLVFPTLRRYSAHNQDGHEQGNMPVQLAHVPSTALRTRSRCRMPTITTQTDHGGAAIAACSFSCQCLCMPLPQESRASVAALCPWRRDTRASHSERKNCCPKVGERLLQRFAWRQECSDVVTPTLPFTYRSSGE